MAKKMDHRDPFLLAISGIQLSFMIDPAAQCFDRMTLNKSTFAGNKQWQLQENKDVNILNTEYHGLTNLQPNLSD